MKREPGGKKRSFSAARARRGPVAGPEPRPCGKELPTRRASQPTTLVKATLAARGSHRATLLNWRQQHIEGGGVGERRRMRASATAPRRQRCGALRKARAAHDRLEYALQSLAVFRERARAVPRLNATRACFARRAGTRLKSSCASSTSRCPRREFDSAVRVATDALSMANQTFSRSRFEEAAARRASCTSTAPPSRGVPHAWRRGDANVAARDQSARAPRARAISHASCTPRPTRRGATTCRTTATSSSSPRSSSCAHARAPKSRAGRQRGARWKRRAPHARAAAGA